MFAVVPMLILPYLKHPKKDHEISSIYFFLPSNNKESNIFCFSSLNIHFLEITVILCFSLSRKKNMNSATFSSSSSSSSAAVSSMGEQQMLHVLAVDDSLVDRKIVEKLLKNSSFKVTTAESGLKALEILGLADGKNGSAANSASKVHMIITDYCMPGMNGYELLKKIKESLVMKDVPVVIMSSENVPTRISKCLEEGAKMFILKPLKPADVKNLRCQLMQCRS